MSSSGKAGAIVLRTALGLSVAIAGGVAAGAAATQWRPVAVATAAGDYPDANKVCVAAGSPNFGNADGPAGQEWCSGYQWGDIIRDSKGKVVGTAQNSPRGYDYRNCTDWVAFRIPQLVQVNVPTGLGHAHNWDDNAPPGTVDGTPEPGDIAVWEIPPGQRYGHVAVVESVNPDGTVNVSEFNKRRDGVYGTRPNLTAHHYIDLNGAGKGINGEDLARSGGSTPSKGNTPSKGSGNLAIDELGFVRTNHGSGRTELVTWHGAPHYTTLRGSTLTGYPTISDPKNVTPLAIDVNGDGVDELGFVRTNHSSGRTELSLWHGSPHYTTHLLTTYTGYPAVSDPANVTPIAVDVNGDGIDELGFVRSNHSSGRTELSIWHGAPHYTTHHSTTLTGYPAITDPMNVRPVAMDLNKDKIDELGFVRTNHSSGRTELVVFNGAPHYTTLRISTLTGYPAISDPTNVTPIALDIHGDGIDELGFVRTNHASGRTELSLWHGSPHYTTHLLTAHTGYPTVSDPGNVTPLAVRLA